MVDNRLKWLATQSPYFRKLLSRYEREAYLHFSFHFSDELNCMVVKALMEVPACPAPIRKQIRVYCNQRRVGMSDQEVRAYFRKLLDDIHWSCQDTFWDIMARGAVLNGVT